MIYSMFIDPRDAYLLQMVNVADRSAFHRTVAAGQFDAMQDLLFSYAESSDLNQVWFRIVPMAGAPDPRDVE